MEICILRMYQWIQVNHNLPGMLTTIGLVQFWLFSSRVCHGLVCLKEFSPIFITIGTLTHRHAFTIWFGRCNVSWNCRVSCWLWYSCTENNSVGINVPESNFIVDSEQLAPHLFSRIWFKLGQHGLETWWSDLCMFCVCVCVWIW